MRCFPSFPLPRLAASLPLACLFSVCQGGQAGRCPCRRLALHQAQGRLGRLHGPEVGRRCLCNWLAQGTLQVWLHSGCAHFATPPRLRLAVPSVPRSPAVHHRPPLHCMPRPPTGRSTMLSLFGRRSRADAEESEDEVEEVLPVPGGPPAAIQPIQPTGQESAVVPTEVGGAGSQAVAVAAPWETAPALRVLSNMDEAIWFSDGNWLSSVVLPASQRICAAVLLSGPHGAPVPTTGPIRMLSAT